MKKEMHIFEKHNLAVEVHWNPIMNCYNCYLCEKDDTYDLYNGAFIKAFLDDNLSNCFIHIVDWCNKNKRQLKNSKPFYKEKQ